MSNAENRAEEWCPALGNTTVQPIVKLYECRHHLRICEKFMGVKLAERKGFEPLVPFQVHTISSRACSSTPAPLRE